MTDVKLTVELLDDLSEEAEDNPLVEVGSVTLSLLIAAARASLDLQAYDELRRGGISVGAAQQAWHMAHAACGALGLIYEETAPADIAAAVYAESAPSAPSQPAESPWVAVSERKPEKATWVICCNHSHVGLAFWQDAFAGHPADPYWHLAFGDTDVPFHNVTHWMPLPARPPEPTNGR